MKIPLIWKRSVMALVLLGGCLYAKNAAAQSGGVCVVNTQTIHFQCYSGCGQNGCSCSGTTDVKEPSGNYGTGVLYSTASTQCCGNAISYITSPDGQCTVHAAPVQAIAEKRLIFFRGCDGRIRLYTVSV